MGFTWQQIRKESEVYEEDELCNIIYRWVQCNRGNGLKVADKVVNADTTNKDSEDV